MTIEIVTPDSVIFSGEATLVQFPGLSGSFEVLHNHAPMIAALKKGKIKIVDNTNATQFFEVKGGVVEVLNNKILVLAD